MPSKYKRHVCAKCRSKKVEYLMKQSSLINPRNGKKEWSCKSCDYSKDTLGSQDTFGTVTAPIINTNCQIEKVMRAPKVPLPSIEEQIYRHYLNTGVDLSPQKKYNEL
jgi:hypothetical protein